MATVSKTGFTEDSNNTFVASIHPLTTPIEYLPDEIGLSNKEMFSEEDGKFLLTKKFPDYPEPDSPFVFANGGETVADYPESVLQEAKIMKRSGTDSPTQTSQKLNHAEAVKVLQNQIHNLQHLMKRKILSQMIDTLNSQKKNYVDNPNMQAETSKFHDLSNRQVKTIGVYKPVRVDVIMNQTAIEKRIEEHTGKKQINSEFPEKIRLSVCIPLHFNSKRNARSSETTQQRNTLSNDYSNNVMAYLLSIRDKPIFKGNGLADIKLNDLRLIVAQIDKISRNKLLEPLLRAKPNVNYTIRQPVDLKEDEEARLVLKILKDEDMSHSNETSSIKPKSKSFENNSPSLHKRNKYILEKIVSPKVPSPSKQNIQEVQQSINEIQNYLTKQHKGSLLPEENKFLKKLQTAASKITQTGYKIPTNKQLDQKFNHSATYRKLPKKLMKPTIKLDIYLRKGYPNLVEDMLSLIPDPNIKKKLKDTKETRSEWQYEKDNHEKIIEKLLQHSDLLKQKLIQKRNLGENNAALSDLIGNLESLTKGIKLSKFLLQNNLAAKKRNLIQISSQTAEASKLPDLQEINKYSKLSISQKHNEALRRPIPSTIDNAKAIIAVSEKPSEVPASHKLDEAEKTLEIAASHDLDEEEKPSEIAASHNLDKVEKPSEISASHDLDEAEKPSEIADSHNLDKAEKPSEIAVSHDLDEAEKPSEIAASRDLVEAEKPLEIATSHDLDKVEKPSEISASHELDEVEKPSEIEASHDLEETEKTSEISASHDFDEAGKPSEIVASHDFDEAEKPSEITPSHDLDHLDEEEKLSEIAASNDLDRLDEEEKPSEIAASNDLDEEEKPSKIVAPHDLAKEEKPLEIAASHGLAEEEKPLDVLTSHELDQTKELLDAAASHELDKTGEVEQSKRSWEAPVSSYSRQDSVATQKYKQSTNIEKITGNSNMTLSKYHTYYQPNTLKNEKNFSENTEEGSLADSVLNNGDHSQDSNTMNEDNGLEMTKYSVKADLKEIMEEPKLKQELLKTESEQEIDQEATEQDDQGEQGEAEEEEPKINEPKQNSETDNLPLEEILMEDKSTKKRSKNIDLESIADIKRDDSQGVILLKKLMKEYNRKGPNEKDHSIDKDNILSNNAEKEKTEKKIRTDNLMKISTDEYEKEAAKIMQDAITEIKSNQEATNLATKDAHEKALKKRLLNLASTIIGRKKLHDNNFKAKTIQDFGETNAIKALAVPGIEEIMNAMTVNHHKGHLKQNNNLQRIFESDKQQKAREANLAKMETSTYQINKIIPAESTLILKKDTEMRKYPKGNKKEKVFEQDSFEGNKLLDGIKLIFNKKDFSLTEQNQPIKEDSFSRAHTPPNLNLFPGDEDTFKLAKVVKKSAVPVKPAEMLNEYDENDILMGKTISSNDHEKENNMGLIEHKKETEKSKDTGTKQSFDPKMEKMPYDKLGSISLETEDMLSNSNNFGNDEAPEDASEDGSFDIIPSVVDSKEGNNEVAENAKQNIEIHENPEKESLLFGKVENSQALGVENDFEAQPTYKMSPQSNRLSRREQIIANQNIKIALLRNLADILSRNTNFRTRPRSIQKGKFHSWQDEEPKGLESFQLDDIDIPDKNDFRGPAPQVNNMKYNSKKDDDLLGGHNATITSDTLRFSKNMTEDILKVILSRELGDRGQTPVLAVSRDPQRFPPENKPVELKPEDFIPRSGLPIPDDERAALEMEEQIFRKSDHSVKPNNKVNSHLLKPMPTAHGTQIKKGNVTTSSKNLKRRDHKVRVHYKQKLLQNKEFMLKDHPNSTRKVRNLQNGMRQKLLKETNEVKDLLRKLTTDENYQGDREIVHQRKKRSVQSPKVLSFAVLCDKCLAGIIVSTECTQCFETAQLNRRSFPRYKKNPSSWKKYKICRNKCKFKFPRLRKKNCRRRCRRRFYKKRQKRQIPCTLPNCSQTAEIPCPTCKKGNFQTEISPSQKKVVGILAIVQQTIEEPKLEKNGTSNHKPCFNCARPAEDVIGENIDLACKDRCTIATNPCPTFCSQCPFGCSPNKAEQSGMAPTLVDRSELHNEPQYLKESPKNKQNIYTKDIGTFPTLTLEEINKMTQFLQSQLLDHSEQVKPVQGNLDDNSVPGKQDRLSELLSGQQLEDKDSKNNKKTKQLNQAEHESGQYERKDNAKIDSRQLNQAEHESGQYEMKINDDIWPQSVNHIQQEHPRKDTANPNIIQSQLKPDSTVVEVNGERIRFTPVELSKRHARNSQEKLVSSNNHNHLKRKKRDIHYSDALLASSRLNEPTNSKYQNATDSNFPIQIQINSKGSDNDDNVRQLHHVVFNVPIKKIEHDLVVQLQQGKIMTVHNVNKDTADWVEIGNRSSSETLLNKESSTNDSSKVIQVAMDDGQMLIVSKMNKIGKISLKTLKKEANGTEHLDDIDEKMIMNEKLNGRLIDESPVVMQTEMLSPILFHLNAHDPIKKVVYKGSGVHHASFQVQLQNETENISEDTPSRVHEIISENSPKDNTIRPTEYTPVAFVNRIKNSQKFPTKDHPYKSAEYRMEDINRPLQFNKRSLLVDGENIDKIKHKNMIAPSSEHLPFNNSSIGVGKTKIVLAIKSSTEEANENGHKNYSEITKVFTNRENEKTLKLHQLVNDVKFQSSPPKSSDQVHFVDIRKLDSMDGGKKIKNKKNIDQKRNFFPQHTENINKKDNKRNATRSLTEHRRGSNNKGLNGSTSKTSVNISKLDEKYVWLSWTTWTECSVTCGEGLQYRQRRCIANISNDLLDQIAIIPHTDFDNETNDLEEDAKNQPTGSCNYVQRRARECTGVIFTCFAASSHNAQGPDLKIYRKKNTLYFDWVPVLFISITLFFVCCTCVIYLPILAAEG